MARCRCRRSRSSSRSICHARNRTASRPNRLPARWTFQRTRCAASCAGRGARAAPETLRRAKRRTSRCRGRRSSRCSASHRATPGAAFRCPDRTAPRPMHRDRECLAPSGSARARFGFASSGSARSAGRCAIRAARQGCAWRWRRVGNGSFRLQPAIGNEPGNTGGGKNHAGQTCAGDRSGHSPNGARLRVLNIDRGTFGGEQRGAGQAV